MATRETGNLSSGPQVMAAVAEPARVDPASGPTPAQLMDLVRTLAADVARRNGAKVEANGQKRTAANSATKG